MFDKVITHKGRFRADECLAVAVLQKLGVRKLVRDTPDPQEAASSQVIKVDVGGVYDPTLSAFDPHQRGGAGGRETDGGVYASAGLIWRHFGLRYLEASGMPMSVPIHQRVDLILFRGVDAADNGKGEAFPPGQAPRLNQMVNWLNPLPNGFETAVSFCQAVLAGACIAAQEYVQAREYVMASQAILDGKVLRMHKYAPWQEHIFSRPDHDQLLYVIHPSDRGGWVVVQVPVAPGSQTGRKPLPEGWAGLVDAKAAEATGVAGCTFVHNNRFMATCTDLGSAMTLALKALA
jgi:uncharacterized UPF0160 family protein